MTQKDSQLDFLYKDSIKRIFKLNITKTQKNILKRFCFYHFYCKAIYPGQKSLAQDIGLTVRTVIRGINALEEMGYITRLQKRSIFGTRLYTLNIETVTFIFRPKPLADKALKHFFKGKMSLQMSHKAIEFKRFLKRGVIHMLPITTNAICLETTGIMKDILKKETKGFVGVNETYGAYNDKKMYNFFQNQCQNDMSQWQAFVKNVALSPYLMGQTPQQFKPPLLWLMRDDIAEKVKNGFYNAYKKPEPLAKTAPETDFIKDYGIQTQNYMNETLKRRLEEEKIEKEKKDFLKIITSLTEQQESAYKKDFEQMMRVNQNDLFLTSGWSSPVIRIEYMLWKKEKITQAQKAHAA